MKMRYFLFGKRVHKDSDFFAMICAVKRGYITLASHTKYFPTDNVDDIESLKKKEKQHIDLLKKNKLDLEVIMGTKAGDLTMLGTTDIFSQNFVDFLKAKIHALKFYPVTIKSKNKLPQYYYVEPDMMAEWIESKNISQHNHILVLKNELNDKDNIYFVEPQFRGAEIFKVKDTQLIIVSTKLKKSIEQAKLTNITFIPISIHR